MQPNQPMTAPKTSKRTLQQDLSLISECLVLAAKDLFRPQFLITLLAIPAVALLVFLILMFIFWNPLREFFFSLISDSYFSTGILWSMGWFLDDPSVALGVVVFILTLLFSLPIGFVFIAIIFSIITPLFILSRIHQLHYPELKKQNQVSILKSIFNSLKASFVYLFWCVIILPTFLIPPLFIFLGHLLTSSLHSKIFSYDVLSEFIPDHKLKEMRSAYKSLFFRMGALSCLILYVPFLNLIGIVFIALAFTHLGLKMVKQNY